MWGLKTLRSYLMCKRFVVFTNHVVLHWFLTIDEQIGRLIRWSLQLAEFDFKAKKIKKGKINAQADALSRLYTDGVTVSHNHNDNISVFELSIVNVQFGPNRNRNEFDFIDTEFTAIDGLYAAEDDPALTNDSTNPIGIEEFLQAQLNDPFRAEIRRKLNQGAVSI